MKPKQIVKVWKKNDILTRKMNEWWLSKKGYQLVSEEDIQRYSGGKGLILGLLFLPLALLGQTKRIKCVYELK